MSVTFLIGYFRPEQCLQVSASFWYYELCYFLLRGIYQIENNFLTL